MYIADQREGQGETYTATGKNLFSVDDDLSFNAINGRGLTCL
jgi:hypothetical protein